MRGGVLIFLFSLFFVSCKNSNKIPKNILPQAKMQAVLWDIIRADKFLADFIFTKDTSLNKDTARINLYQSIFRIHNISKEKFQQSFDFYKTHPPLLKTILDSLDAKREFEPGQEYRRPIGTDSQHFFKRINRPPHNKN